jgi:hypothetical protein
MAPSRCHCTAPPRGPGAREIVDRAGGERGQGATCQRQVAGLAAEKRSRMVGVGPRAPCEPGTGRQLTSGCGGRGGPARFFLLFKKNREINRQNLFLISVTLSRIRLSLLIKESRQCT